MTKSVTLKQGTDKMGATRLVTVEAEVVGPETEATECVRCDGCGKHFLVAPGTDMDSLNHHCNDEAHRC